jgi:hypothetical protein
MKRETLFRFDVYDETGQLVGEVKSKDIRSAIEEADKAFPPVEPEQPAETEAITPEGLRVIGPKEKHGS